VTRRRPGDGKAIEALAAAGQAADMMSAALAEARAATQPLTQARHRGWERPAGRGLTGGRRSQSHQASTPSPVRALTRHDLRGGG